jgi:Ca2+-binding EF-hand superfamily protein
VWNTVDVDGSGRLDKEELGDVLKRIGSPPPPPQFGTDRQGL